MEAVTIAARMAACFGVLITKAQPMTGMATGTDKASIERKKINLEPGMWQELRPGDGVAQIKAEQPTTNFSDFLIMLVRLVGIPFGLPVELFFDFSNANFSNHKAAMLQAQRAWGQLQDVVGRTYSRIYRWKITQWIESGALPPREDALEHDWVTPGWRWLDPTKEIQAAIAAIDAGLEAPSAIVAGQGTDFDKMLTRRAKDLKRIGEDLPPIRGTFTRDPVAPSAAPGTPEKPGAGEDPAEEEPE